jgi:hypothetical protein
MVQLRNINSGFWIGDFGLLTPAFARLPAIRSVALFPRIDISPKFVRTYAVEPFLAGAAREKSSKIQKIRRRCVSLEIERLSSVFSLESIILSGLMWRAFHAF